MLLRLDTLVILSLMGHSQPYPFSHYNWQHVNTSAYYYIDQQTNIITSSQDSYSDKLAYVQVVTTCWWIGIPGLVIHRSLVVTNFITKYHYAKIPLTNFRDSNFGYLNLRTSQVANLFIFQENIAKLHLSLASRN